MTRVRTLATLTVAALAVPGAAGRAFGDDDAAVRRALVDEMARSMKDLRIAGEPRPHLVVYRIIDSEQASASATFGAVTASNRRRWRSLGVEVRVGDRKLDSGNFADPMSFGPVAQRSAPLEDDYSALRRELWRRTDEAFKRALEAISRKQAAAKTEAAGEEQPPLDFVDVPPGELVVTGEGARSALDQAAMTTTIKGLSALFREFPAIHGSTAGGQHVIIRRRILTSDGSWIDERRSLVELDVNAETQAPDGMRLSSWVPFQATSLQGLPTFAEMEKRTRQMATDLTAMRSAPIGEAGNAVVLFEGRASGQLLRRLLADQLSGTPPPRGPSGDGPRPDTATFAGQLGQRIAPAFLSVYDDPRQELGPDRTPLFGAYRADDEGVAAEKVSLVEKGIVKSLLMSRTPCKEILRSNGHGRGPLAAGAMRGRAGVLTVSAGPAGLSAEALRARAVQEARAAGGKTTVYVVRHVDASISFSGTARAGVVKPLMIFRLRDGKEELVRGITFANLVPRSLKDLLVAAARDQAVYNYLNFGEAHPAYGGSAGSLIAPSVLLKDVEVRKDTQKYPKPPLYPHPHFAGR
jgi:TldD protein